MAKCYYIYGMRLRGFSPGCQPKEGLVEAEDDIMGDYHNVLVYSRPLTIRECKDFELDYLGKRAPS